MKVAVLLAAYNGVVHVSQQLDSILKSSVVGVSIFLSVDASNDGTEELINSLSITYPRIFLLQYGERYGSAGANFFRLLRDVSFDEFDYVAFADQDDIWAEDKLIRAISTLDKENTNIYSSNVTAFWDDGREILIDKAQAQKKWDHYFEAAGPGCTYVMTAVVANQLKALLNDNSEKMKGIALHDWFIYAWARHNDLNWYIDPKPSMRYRQHANNVVGVNNGFLAAKSRFNKLAGGWYLEQIMLIANAINANDVLPIQWIKNPSLLNKLKLLFSISSCRRRVRDRLGFIAFILMLRKHDQ
ncbi:glycosyltransferase [Deefgea sp. CFH1-16]|uniref:glycosyltransferase n=1 Tax=Deefgea sp. CFH1-16 TaxID=2675457 RepID=UPI0015F57BAF|nr:glycosyltransferase [Deefgea sp. CFH1-16]MBM5573547.1 glycosyltransferase [Deefgea sp. CFH1-16]